MSEMHFPSQRVYLKSSGVQKDLKSTPSKLQPANIEIWRFLLIILIISVIAIALTILIEYFMASFFEDNPDIRWVVTTMPTFRL
jgi:heme/copper-type cytochrome/quinol oxidase subunit 2